MAYQSVFSLDTTDWSILEALQTDARLPLTELGRWVGLSRPAVTERLRRLEEAGIITGYHAAISLDKVGLPVSAFMRLRSSEGKCHKIMAQVAQLPEVLACYRVTGSDDLIARVAVKDVNHLEKVIDQLSDESVVTTLVVLSTVVEGRLISASNVSDERLGLPL